MAAFYVENFGCRAARADGEAVSARLRADGLSERSLAEADVVVVNTCSVTAEADRDARAFVRKTRRLNPEARVVVTGCYAQRAPEEIAALDGVAAVVGNSHKGMLPEIIHGMIGMAASSSVPSPSLVRLDASAPVWADDHFAHSFIENAQVLPGAQTRPNLKIQEGCGNRCTFCVIPTTRGNSRSLPPEKVLAQVRGFVAAGGKELVISGINLGRWGRDLDGSPSFPGLLRNILDESEVSRLRLSSIEPMDWTPELIALFREFAGVRIARHAHLPLQSGSDTVLRRMHRRYRPWHYAQKIAELAETVGPELAIGADVMVGFPGESEAEFLETHDFIASQPFSYLHLFPFSPRPGTRSWDLHRQNPVSSQAVRERMAALRGLAAEKTQSFRSRLVGHTVAAITLHTPEALTSQGRTSALTDNYIPVELDQVLPANILADVILADVDVTAINPGGILRAHINLRAGNLAVAG
jgi:threonylcarbamoyladenosine tRNA methylthiotransferase MtaB